MKHLLSYRLLTGRWLSVTANPYAHKHLMKSTILKGTAPTPFLEYFERTHNPLIEPRILLSCEEEFFWERAQPHLEASDVIQRRGIGSGRRPARGSGSGSGSGLYSRTSKRDAFRAWFVDPPIHDTRRKWWLDPDFLDRLRTKNLRLSWLRAAWLVYGLSQHADDDLPIPLDDVDLVEGIVSSLGEGDKFKSELSKWVMNHQSEVTLALRAIRY